MSSESPAGDVGERLAEILADLGVPGIFGVPGGQTIPLYRATRARGARHVVMRDERNAACAADACARATGSIGVCDATVGPGATNLVSGLAESLAASVPVLAVVADIRSDQEHLRRRANASQAVEQGPLLGTVSKWVGRVERGEMLDDVVDQALRVATTGRPGPAVVEVPEDVWSEPAERRRTFGAGDARWPRFRPVPAARDVEAAADLLAGASRPVVLAGGGALASGAAGELRAWVEEQQLPVVTTMSGKGVVDESSPLSLGVVGLFGAPGAAIALERADVVVVLGSKLAQVSTHGWRLPSDGARIVHVDVDGEELGRVRQPEVAVVADARETVIALRRHTGGRAGSRSRSWRVADESPNGAGQGRTSAGGALHPTEVVRAVGRVLDPGDTVVCDASYASGWAAADLRVSEARHFLAPRGLAGIGWSAGAAVGAAVGRGTGRIVTLAGDGGWAYGMGELETAARLGLDVTVVVLNNSGLGWVVHGEERMGMAERSTYTDVDFAAVARGLGAGAGRASTEEELDEQLERATGASGPYLVDVVVDEEASPIVSLRAARAAEAGA